LTVLPGNSWSFAPQKRLEGEENLCRGARTAGIDSKRVIFAARIELIERDIARLAFAGLFLDSHSDDAHPTASDAVLAGLPSSRMPESRGQASLPVANCTRSEFPNR
jgi:hypothetical protein